MVCDNNESQESGSNDDLRTSSPLIASYCLRRMLLVSSSTSDSPTSRREGNNPTRYADVSSAIGTKRNELEESTTVIEMNAQKETIGKILQAAIDLVNEDDMMGHDWDDLESMQ